MGVDRRAVAGEEQGGGVELLDNRRSRDRITRQQGGAVVDRRILRGIRSEPYRAVGGRRRLAVLALVARPRGRLAELADREEAEVHDLHRVGRIVEAVGELVLGEEVLLD